MLPSSRFLHLEGSQGTEERKYGSEEERRVREDEGYTAGEKEVKEDRTLWILKGDASSICELAAGLAM